MRHALLSLALLACLPCAAFGATIDDFSLTNSSQTITISWSIPASPANAAPQIGAGGFDAGFIIGSLAINNNGIHSTGFIQFISPLGGTQTGDNMDFGGLLFQGPTLYTGTSASPTFDIGTFSVSELTGNLGIGAGTLTITPEAATTPELSSLILLATGAMGLLGFTGARRQRC
jgi:hypothetical protein